MGLSRTSMATLVAGGLLAAGVAGAGALTATGAVAAPSAPTPAPSASGGTVPDVREGVRPGRRGHGGHGHGGPKGIRGGFGRPLHGELVVPGADGTGTRTVLVQRGTVTARTGTSVTVRSTDGFTVTWAVDARTTVRTGPRAGTTTPPSVDGLAVGDVVHVTGDRTASGGTAAFIGRRPPGGRGGAAAPGATPTPDTTTSGWGTAAAQGPAATA